MSSAAKTPATYLFVHVVVRDAAFSQATLAVAAHDHVVHVTEDVVKLASNNKDGRCYGNGPDTNCNPHGVQQ